MNFHKYKKYKKKYLDLKNTLHLDNQKAGSEDSTESSEDSTESSENSLLNVKDIIKLFNNKFRFVEIYKQNQLDKLFYYSQINFKFKKGISYDDFKKLAENNKPDVDFYLYLRKYYDTDHHQIINYQVDFYKNKQVVKKVLSIKNILEKFNITNLNKVLDVGTEDINYLNVLGKNLHARTQGLNIDSGYEHYKGQFNKAVATKRIILYDGINFPFRDNEFGLVTLIAVVHHVEKLELFFKNLCKITKLIYIKDNDISNKITEYCVEIQHEMYEGVLYPNNRSPLYYHTNEQVTKILKMNGFKILYNYIYPEFTKSYTLLAIKE